LGPITRRGVRRIIGIVFIRPLNPLGVAVRIDPEEVIVLLATRSLTLLRKIPRGSPVPSVKIVTFERGGINGTIGHARAP
jgi:hypothetical protein